MARTLLVCGPPGAGKTLLIRSLAEEHPDFNWHLLRLLPAAQSDDPQRVWPALSVEPWAGLWQYPYRPDALASDLPVLMDRIASHPAAHASQAIVAVEAEPDPVLRHVWPFDLRVFVLPPNEDESLIFRSKDEARQALEQVLRNSAAFAAETLSLFDGPLDGVADQQIAEFLADDSGELTESQVDQFLRWPLGAELAARIQLKPTYEGIVDSDIVVTNTSAGSWNSGAERCWQRLLALLKRLRRPDGGHRLAYACDLSDPQDPCLQRILHKMGEKVCTL